MSKDFTVTVTDPVRAAEWQAVLGTATTCVTTPILQRASLPGHLNALVYFVDLTQLTDAQRDALVAHLSRKFNVPADEVRAQLERDPDHAVPILDEDCILTIDKAYKWC